MRRFREDRPADVCFARGTFNSHPYVMGAMHEFLSASTPRKCGRAMRIWMRPGTRAPRLSTSGWKAEPTCASPICRRYGPSATRNRRATTGCCSIYLRGARARLELGGHRPLHLQPRLPEADFAAVADRFVAAALQMQREGWWWQGATLTNKSIRRRVLREMLRAGVRPSPDRTSRPAAAAEVLGNKA